ncbi:general substrate transporter [Paraphoma chrysanthemicola]|uniref:General substrate transporter n=1 Tax=Paraphoma chrysanthemicola TaxID=798071 RepID=A0A8K0R257_9PLEO|nr:general substrate transporter [Paraphoma chrysanthemicola]
MLNNLRILPAWKMYFDDPVGSTLGLLTALYSIGSIALLPVAPLIADHLGRKAAIAIGCIIMIVAASLQAAAKNLGYFMGERFLMGFGNSLAQLSSPLLLTEICHPQHRARVTAVYNCLWNVGDIVCTWLTFGTKRIDNDWCWRVPALTQALPSVIQLAFVYFIPESPRWLIPKERNEEALDMLVKYHANGNVNNATVQFEYAEIKETLRLEFLYKKTSSYLDFFKTRGNRYRLLLIVSLSLFSQWSGNGLVSYYATDVYNSIDIRDPDTQLGINGGLDTLSLIVSVSCALLIDRVGRRPLFITATASMCVTFIVWTICSSEAEGKGSKSAGQGVNAMIWIFSVAYALAWSGLLVAYTVEILPFKIRAKGLMLMNLFIQIALTNNQYVNPLGFAHLKPTWKFYTIYACWIFLELIFLYFFYAEIRGPTLEEIAKIFDGEQAEVAHIGIETVEANVLASGHEKDDKVRVEDVSRSL